MRQLAGSGTLPSPYPLPCLPAQNILGLILVKELVLVDETAGVKVRDLRIREVPFIRCAPRAVRCAPAAVRAAHAAAAGDALPTRPTPPGATSLCTMRSRCSVWAVLTWPA